MTFNQDCNQGRDCNCAGWHVVPLNDLREHVTNGSCWCRPTLDEGVWLMLACERFEAGTHPNSLNAMAANA